MSPRAVAFSLLGLLTVGWLAVWSSAGWAGEGSRQLSHIVIGLGLLGLCTHSRPLAIRWAAIPFYWACVLALALVLLPGIGQTVNGSQRWLSLGPLGSWQPSEFSKLALILILARVYQGRPGRPPGWGSFLLAGGCTAIFFGLIAKQPDLGTALVLGAIFFGMSWVAGAPALGLFGLVAGGLAAAPFVLHDYQKNRLLIFLHPETDPRGLGYHITQSQCWPSGPGGLVGQGLGQGALSAKTGLCRRTGRTSYSRLSARNWACWVRLGAACCWLALLAAQLLRVTWHCKDRYEALVSSGVCTLLGFQGLVNLSMTVGLAPVVGIPLPFCTYGGSAMLINLVAVGLIMGSSQAESTAPKLQELLQQTDPSRDVRPKGREQGGDVVPARWPASA
jgi:rod shape determining protein RodA